jgi:hypothetical protein
LLGSLELSDFVAGGAMLGVLSSADAYIWRHCSSQRVLAL